MGRLAKVYVFKIAATVLFWAVPLVFFPGALLEAAGIPEQPTFMFLRMLGWAYIALCVGYGFGLAAALQGECLLPPLWVGLISNGGACVLLSYYGAIGTWNDWGLLLQTLGWSSVGATALITVGLYVFGVRNHRNGTAPKLP